MSEPILRHLASRGFRGAAFLRAVSELSFDCSIVVDAGGRIKYQSPSTVRVLGYGDGEAVGRHYLEFPHPHDRARVRKVFRHVARLPGSSRTVECRLRRADGRSVWADIRLTNRLDDPTVRGVVANAVLIEDRKTLEMRHAAAKVDPHFLYNVLHTVASLVRDGRDADAVEALARIRGLTEGTLGGADDLPVTLQEEWDWIADYAALEQLRFGPSLRVEIEPLPRPLQDFPVPARLVQPLVENAVKHGLRTRTGGGRLHLRAEARGGQVRIVVEEDGEPVAGREETHGFRSGLRTLRQRLALHFGDDAGVRLRVYPSRSIATLTLPAPADPLKKQA
jgi:PAS domain S-box-containing protein